uniref:Tyrosine-protein phosphatase domain-containing protein n=1 Tax=Heterorhabditis bacteriophora TaxID=37862 RepID=A0A1I7X889_HETBA
MQPTYLIVLLAVLLLPSTSPLLLYGCTLADNLCEPHEQCVADGVFGQCYSADSSAPLPTVIDRLDDTQLELLRLELTRLSNSGQEWPDQKTQCVLAYFKLSMYYGLQYDLDFCQVRNPANIWALIQPVPVDSRLQYTIDTPSKSKIDEVIPLEDNEKPELSLEELEKIPEEEIQEILDQIQEPAPEVNIDELLADNRPGDPIVEKYLEQIVREENPDLSVLTDDQLNELIQRLYTLKSNLSRVDYDQGSLGEAEEAIPLDALRDEQSVLKKDAEELGEVNQGLENTEHKIVKGRNAVSRVVGNRVYLKVREQYYKIASGKLQLLFRVNKNDAFIFDNSQLSMRISRIEGSKPKNDKRIDTVEGVAQAVYKRRKDIARLSGAEVAETGIGIGEARKRGRGRCKECRGGSGEAVTLQDSVPVESSERDWIFMPVLFICAFTITALLSVLIVHVVKNHRHYKNNIQHVAEQMEGKSSLAYQELCRQRMNQEAVPSGRGSKSSSTSSWCEEAASQPSIDISTGHVILNFLQEYLSDPTRIEAQWESIKDYHHIGKQTTIGEQFTEKNRSVTPCMLSTLDDNLVSVDSWKEGETEYLNASFVYDDDPRQAVYIAAQSPRAADLAAFWQAIWQHGVCLIVNLSTIEEGKQEKSYWPEAGSEVHGPFEVRIHLVSEHIWSDDYLVRSFYLKNLRNGQTRTITQFHYLSWNKDSTPTSPKSLLEFRRKVNKSYRGRSSPVLVHSWDGAGRAGVYCAVDLLCARLLRGVRQLDVVASVEHLRDQRSGKLLKETIVKIYVKNYVPKWYSGMVRTADQFKLIYGCVAQEVSALLKALPH